MNKSIFEDIGYLDFHTHTMRHQDENGVIEIVSIHLGKEREKEFFTVGLHPWWSEKIPSENELKELRRLLDEPNNLAMGEMGLDNLKGPDLNIQMNILRAQLNLAMEFQKPVIIHCVRAFDQLIRIKKEFPKIDKWCVHGFGRHATLAKQLIDQGFYLSLMPSSDSKYQDWFDSLPHDKLFLETDSMAGVDINEVYQKVSDVSGLKLEDLRRQINVNATEFFNR